MGSFPETYNNPLSLIKELCHEMYQNSDFRLLCCMFWLAFLDLIVHNLPWRSYHFEITDQ